MLSFSRATGYAILALSYLQSEGSPSNQTNRRGGCHRGSRLEEWLSELVNIREAVELPVLCISSGKGGFLEGLLIQAASGRGRPKVVFVMKRLG